MPFYRCGSSLIVFLSLILAVLIASSVRAEQDSPQQAIEHFHDTLIGVMREADALGYEGRYEWLKPVIVETFNLAFMARVSTGYHWKKATESEHKALVDAFTDMTIANYASRFDGFSGETFETLATESAPRDSVLVKTQIIDSDGKKVTLNYVMRESDGQWKVVDIYLKGTFSELATRRSEYSSLIRDGGLENLISSMKKKTVNIAKKAEPP